MTKLYSFSEDQIENIARTLGECGTGAEIDRCLSRLNIDAGNDGGMRPSKWRRLYDIFVEREKIDGCSHALLRFIKEFASPIRGAAGKFDFEWTRAEINEMLAFSGLEYTEYGKFRSRSIARTIKEASAEQREKAITGKMLQLDIHPEVLKYCRAEYMSENYFHALLEAVKGLERRIKDLTGLNADGESLVDKAFLGNNPLLKTNSYQTETEKTVHRGLAYSVKSCIASIRNPLAHEPKLIWEWDNENEVTTWFLFISLIHHKLDKVGEINA